MRRLCSLLLVLLLAFSGTPCRRALAADAPLPPGEIEDWALGCGAILATHNALDPYQFGMFAKTETGTEGAASLLGVPWGCEDRETLISTVARMTDGGHNDNFARDYAAIADLSQEDFEASLSRFGATDQRMWQLTRTLGEKWGDKQIKAWDWFRMLHILGWGYVAGYLELSETYALMTPVIQRLRGTFSSWEEATENYLDGYAWWSLTDPALPDTDYQQRLAIHENLKGDPALYNPELWLPEGAPRTRRYADGFAYRDLGDGACALLRAVGAPWEGGLSLPDTLDGLTVTAIGPHAFTDGADWEGPLVLPQGLTEIGDYAFAECLGLAGDLDLPEGLHSIGRAAFFYCPGFTGELRLPASLETVGQDAFSYCYGFTGPLDLPEGLTTLDAHAFSNCDGLTALAIPRSLTDIADGAFTGCRGVESIQVSPENPAYRAADGILFDRAFTRLLLVPKGIRLHDYAIPDGVTAIGDWAFFGCGALTGTLTLPDSVSEIGIYAFGDCAGLTGLRLPAGLREVSREAFNGCTGLTGTLDLPAGVRVIDKGAFAGCEGLTGVDFPEGLTHIGNYAFSACTSLTGIVLPADLTSLGDWAFQGCESLSLAEFQSGVPAAFGTEVFANCAVDFRIFYPADSDGWSGPVWRDYRCYANDDPRRMEARNDAYDFLFAVTGEGVCAITGYRGVQGGDLIIPARLGRLTVTAIGAGAFRYVKGFSGQLIIPDTVRTIEEEAFKFSGGFPAVTIPKGVIDIGKDAFSMGDLAAFEVDPENQAFSAVDGILFNKDQTVLLYAPRGREIGDYAVPEGVTALGDIAFRTHRNFTGHLTLPASLRTIGVQALSGSNISGVTFSEGVTRIERQAFCACDHLTAVTLPGSLTFLGENAFSSSDALSRVVFCGDAPEELGEEPFHRCAEDFQIRYDPGTTGWSTPHWNGYPAYPRETVRGAAPGGAGAR